MKIPLNKFKTFPHAFSTYIFLFVYLVQFIGTYNNLFPFSANSIKYKTEQILVETRDNFLLNTTLDSVRSLTN